MTEPPTGVSSKRRLLRTYWIMNTLLIGALLAFALRW